MQLSALYRYPLKSGAGERLDAAQCDQLGVMGDRRWMVVDATTSHFLTQRILPKMALLQAHWSGESVMVLNAPGMQALRVDVPDTAANQRGVLIWRNSTVVPDAGDTAAQWLTALLGRSVRLVYLPVEAAIQIDQGYANPDEYTSFTDGFPFLLIGQASLDDLVGKVGRPLDMQRFRPSLVVAGAEPFAEDRWKRIRIGSMEFRVVKPCSRCVIPTIDLLTGERAADREPLATLMTYRKAEGGVFFGQNLIAEGQGKLEVGMTVEVLEH